MADSGERPDKPFLYDAFISYRHVDRDRKWAEWLIAALEGYRVPKALRDKGLPPRLRKIFRDEDELPSSADLNDQIREALVSSRFLIVVCSAFTPRSKWVEREIQIFNELGRGDQVLALLTEGEPGDSFPDAMLLRHREVVDADGSRRTVKEAKEPLAADVRPRPGVATETSKRLALLRLVAVILGVKFDDLRQREHEHERKRHLTWAAVTAALILLIGGSGGFYWNMVRPHTTYYRYLVWRWGLPEGAWPIDTAAHGHLARSYTVVTQRGKVMEVRYDGWLHSQTDEARWLVRYGDDSSAQKIDIFSETGRLLQEKVLNRGGPSNKIIVSYERFGIPLAQDATHDPMTDPTNGNPAPAQNRSEITRHELTFDANGFSVEVRYQDNWGTPQHDAQGSFGERYTYSREGLVLRSSEIGQNGEDITLKNGVHAVTSSYDSEGRLVQRTLLGEDGRPINGPDGYAYFIRDYDPSGFDNNTAQTYYSADGKPTLSRDGYSKLMAQHDEHGNNTEVAFAGADGKLIAWKNGYVVDQRKFDDRGRVIAEAFFDVNRQPTYSTSGFAGDTVSYDQHNNIIELDYFGIDGKPTITKQGYAKVMRAFDAHGNMVKEAYFGIDGKPAPGKRGFASVRQTFDERDNLIERAIFGVDGKPTLNVDGIAGIKYRYDARGNEIERAFFGVDGNPTLSKDGNASYRRTLDDRGRLIAESYFGVKDEPVLDKPIGAATTRYAYDAHGNATETDYLGVDGKPILAIGGFATYRVTYDERGLMTDVSMFGVDGKPAESFEGVAHAHIMSDLRGNIVERAFYGLDGKLTLGAAGHAGFRNTYDDRGDLIEVTALGLDGKPIISKQGFASYRQLFDDRRQLIDQSYFGVDGKPLALPGGSVARITDAYDTRGNTIETAFFGVDGKPAVGIGGFAGFRQAFDARNNLVMKAYFGVDGKPVAVRDGGFAKVTWDYDARGDLIEESYFGADGQPAHDDGCVTIKYTYDASGRQTKVTYLDAQNHELQMELIIRRVTPGGPGALAGLAPGDHMLSYNGQAVGSIKQWNDLTTSGTYPFRGVTVRRGSRIITLQVERGNLDINLGLASVDTEKEVGDPSPTLVRP